MRGLVNAALLVSLLASIVWAAPATPTTAGSNTCSNGGVFGVARQQAAALNVRGGEVLEPATLEDVESILLKASTADELVVIDFSATWCGPCKMIAPLYEEMSESMEGVVFLKVDVDENPDTAAKYSVSAMPTFVFLKKGEVVDRLMGANPARLKEMIEEHM